MAVGPVSFDLTCRSCSIVYMNLAILFAAVSSTFSLPQGLLSATCWVESRHNVSAVNIQDGDADSIGLCQIKLATAKAMGFKGTAKQLQKPSVNVFWAGAYLRHQMDRYDGNHRRALAAYNAGACKFNKNGLILNRKYVNKVVLAWVAGK